MDTAVWISFFITLSSLCLVFSSSEMSPSISSCSALCVSSSSSFLDFLLALGQEASCQSSPYLCNCCSWGSQKLRTHAHIDVGHARVGRFQMLFIHEADESLQQSFRVDLQALHLLHQRLTFVGSVCTDDPHAPVQLLSFGDFGGRFPWYLVHGFPCILGYGHP